MARKRKPPDEAEEPAAEPNPSTPAGKSTATTVAQRVEEVLRIRIDGAAPQQVKEYASQQGWNVSERQLRNYMRKADELFKKQRIKRRGLLLSIHHARREGIFARAIAAQDLRVALAVLDSMARLDGFFVDESAVREMMKLSKESKEKLEALEKRLNDGQETREAAETPD